MQNEELIRVYVGADRTQKLAAKVLAYSIKRHTTSDVKVIPMIDLPVPKPNDPRNDQRTLFSFSRFCIPKLAGYQGRAIYMDADMLVFQDIRELWNIPFDGAKVVIQKEVKYEDVSTRKVGAPKKRNKQCAVMLLDCARLEWDIEAIVDDMDHCRYDYEQLMYELCILGEGEVKFGVPFEWNSLEHWDADTRLLHYTDVYTQPWTAVGNKHGDLWFAEIRHMLRHNAISLDEVQTEIDLGFFRPSLIRDIEYRQLIPAWLMPVWDKLNHAMDRVAGYVPHKDVYEAKRIRQQAIKDYEANQTSLAVGEENA